MGASRQQNQQSLTAAAVILSVSRVIIEVLAPIFRLSYGGTYPASVDGTMHCTICVWVILCRLSPPSYTLRRLGKRGSLSKLVSLAFT